VTIQPRFDIVTILFSPDGRGQTERHGPRGIGVDCSCVLSLFELTAERDVIIRGRGC
jgi:hypothetical protein